MPNAKLAVQARVCGWLPIEDAARAAIALAGRLNAPVAFDYQGVELVVGTSDCTSDVIRQHAEKRAEGGGGS